jgi:hypothetical protein
MIESDDNYARLERQFFANTGAEKGEAVVASFTRRHRIADLIHLLRHHSEDGVEGRETYLRDEIDYLLSYYGILEIASLIGFVPNIPGEAQRKLLGVLTNPALRVYYEENYPLVLPQLLSRRLSGNLSLHEDVGRDGLTRFMHFIILTKTMDIDDDDVETFLWFLDDGDRDDYDWDDLMRALDQPRVFTNALATSPRQRDPRDHAINGFRKFLIFCTQFNSLLAASLHYRLMTAEMYAHHAYWFVSLRDKVGRRVGRAVRKFRTQDETDSAFARQLSKTETAIESLLSGRYLMPLKKYHPIEVD